MRYGIGLAAVLYGVWLLWSGHYTPLLMGLGVVSSLLVVWIAHRMDILDQESVPLDIFPRILIYLPWLFWQIFKANLDVARRIINPRLPVSPRVIKVPASQKRDLGRVIYANSITLTPGTLTIDTTGDTITVHALTPEAAEGLQTGEMDRRVARLEGRS